MDNINMTIKIFLFAILSSGFIISAAQTNTTASTEENTSGSEDWNNTTADLIIKPESNINSTNSSQSKTPETQKKQFIENFKNAVNSTLKEDLNAFNNSTKSIQDIIANGRELERSGPQFFYRMMSGNQNSKK